MLSTRRNPGRTLIVSFFITTVFFLFFATHALAATVTLAWDRPDSDAVAGYHIYYGLSGTSYKGSPRQTINSPDQTQIDIADLEPEETYAFAAASHDGNGNESRFSEEITYQVPLPPEDEKFTITASAGNGGSIAPAGDTVVSHGESLTYAISPATGYAIADVTVNGSSEGATAQYTFSEVTADNSISAAFEKKTYTITASAGTGGSIAPAGDTVVSHGESISYAISPDSGYEIADVTVNGSSVGAVESYTIQNTTSENTITAVFSEIDPAEYFSGSGTSEDPFLIFDSDQLDRVREWPDSHFKLEQDIDLADFEGFAPIGSLNAPFTGSFDGNGHIIENLVIDESYLDYIGVFACLEGAIIRNTGIENAEVLGRDYVGILAGYAINATITEVYATGFVSGQHFVGGIAGSMEATSAALISDAYTDCNVDGDSDVGGLIGNLGLNAEIERTYTVGHVQGDTDIGGLVGWNDCAQHDNVTISFWDSQIGPDESEGGTSRTTDEMMQQSTFTNWDFDSTWTIDEGKTCPKLQWQAVDSGMADDSYTITASAGPGGSIDPDGETVVSQGESVSYTISPDNGYQIADITVNGSSVGPVAEYTFSDVEADNTISAVFEKNSYTITASAGSGGSITPAGDTVVSPGESVTYTISPDSDHNISDVTVNGSSVGAVSSYTINNVSSDNTIYATFQKQRSSRWWWFWRWWW